MRGKWSGRIVARAFVNAKVFDVVALEVVHCSSLLLVYDLSIAPLHAIATDNLEKVFFMFFSDSRLTEKSPYPIIIIKLEDCLFFVEHRQKKERLKAARGIENFPVLVTRVIVLH